MILLEKLNLNIQLDVGFSLSIDMNLLETRRDITHYSFSWHVISQKKLIN